LDARTNGDPAASIHSARKDLKKLRSAIRLVRSELGEDLFRGENRRYRDAGRTLGQSRDAEVKIKTLEALQERFGDALPRRRHGPGRLS
jgi:CHAD domain-containing protein